MCYGLFVNPNSEQIKRSKYFSKLFARLLKEFEFFIFHIFHKQIFPLGLIIRNILLDRVCAYVSRRKKWNFQGCFAIEALTDAISRAVSLKRETFKKYDAFGTKYANTQSNGTVECEMSLKLR